MPAFKAAHRAARRFAGARAFAAERGARRRANSRASADRARREIFRRRDVGHEPRRHRRGARRLHAGDRGLHAARGHARRVPERASPRAPGAAGVGADEIVRAARAANALADLYAHALRSVCLAARRRGARRRRRRRARPDRAPSPARRLDAADQQSGARGRARLHDGGRRLPHARHRGRRAGRAAGARVSRGDVPRARSPSRDRQPRRHREHHRPAAARRRARLRHRARATSCSTCGTRAIATRPSTRDGAFAASGTVDATLLAAMLARALLRARRRPRAPAAISSTRRGSIGAGRGELDRARGGRAGDAGRADRAHARATPFATHCAGARGAADLCGGGARNADLVRRIAGALPDVQVASTDAVGVASEHVEALAFAWLARETLAGRPGNLPDSDRRVGPARARRDLSALRGA